MYMSHTQIGKEDYACISKMLRAGYSYSEIARTINKHASSVSKHVRGYGGRDAYDAKEVRRKKHQERILGRRKHTCDIKKAIRLRMMAFFFM